MADQPPPRADAGDRPERDPADPRDNPQRAAPRGTGAATAGPAATGTRTGVTPTHPGQEAGAEAPVTAPVTAPGREAPRDAAIEPDAMRDGDQAAPGRPASGRPVAHRSSVMAGRPMWQWIAAGVAVVVLLILIF